MTTLISFILELGLFHFFGLRSVHSFIIHSFIHSFKTIDSFITLAKVAPYLISKCISVLYKDFYKNILILTFYKIQCYFELIF